MIKNILLVGLGGATGSIARYLCYKWITPNFTGGFPWSTFVVNLSGCLLIGLLWGAAARSGWLTESWRFFLMTGLCGGFTTFSAFTLESAGLLREAKFSLFFLYITGSVLLGLLATIAGIRIVKLAGW